LSYSDSQAVGIEAVALGICGGLEAVEDNNPSRSCKNGDDGKWCGLLEFSTFHLQQAPGQDPEGRDMWEFKPSHAAAADSVKFGQPTQLSEGYLSAYRESDVSSKSV
jgi:hypothetical protein